MWSETPVLWSYDEQLNCYPVGMVYLNYDRNCKRLRHNFSDPHYKHSGFYVE